MKPQASSRGRYLVGLDGLRALAVIGVVVYHLAPGALPGGFIGVDIFFVISGLLITTLLIEERNATGRIDFKKFWIRRARRLLPALFATICIVSCVAFFIRGDILVGLGRQILGAATFSNNWVEVAAGSNYFDASNPHLFTNFWSLAVEEQFYAVWPFIIFGLICLPFWARRPKLSVGLCGLLAAGSAVLMIVLFQHTNATRVYYGTDTHLFGLMIGALLAFRARAQMITAMRHPEKTKRYNVLARRLGLPAFAGIIAIMVLMTDQSSCTYDGGLVLASILAAFVILATITKRGILQRLFTWKPLEWIGIRSYGIYLWHWPILILLRHILPASDAVWVIGGITCILTLAIAAISYRYLETPIRAVGLRAFARRGIQRRAIMVDDVIIKWKLHPHPILVASCFAIILTVVTIVGAPSKTTAQLRIEEGQAAIRSAALQQARKAPPKPDRSQAPSGQVDNTPPPVTQAEGTDITVIGDSVTLASAPALEARFPGILIDAIVSRSLRQGGFTAIDGQIANGTMRGTVVIALGTNGYYGTGNLDKLINELGGRKIIFVTSHAPEAWAQGNNDNLRATAAKYPNVRLAEWDTAISQHADELADGIHPGAAGAQVYADCIAVALAQFH